MRARERLAFAAGGLRGHRLRTGLSLLGVAIGVASVTLLTSLGEGARLYVTGEFASLGSNLLIVLPGRTETSGSMPFLTAAPHDLTVEDTRAIAQRIPAVQRVAPVALGSASAGFGARRRDTIVIGTTAAMLGVRSLRMGTGRFLPEGLDDAPLCVLGSRVASELFAGGNPLGQPVRIGETRCRVIGVLAPRGTSIGMNVDESVYVPVETAMRMFNRSSLFRILVEARSHDRMDAVQRSVTELLRERHDGDLDFTVLTQDAVLSAFESILRILTAALAGIAAISLGVAGIGIMNVMLVSVSERTREVGLLKALGVTREQVIGVFLTEAAMISTAGGVVGLGAGIAIGRIVTRFVPDLRVQPPVWAVLAALAVSLSVGILFGILPARRAAGLDPVEALTRRRA